MNFQTATSTQVAEYFGMTDAGNGFQAVDTKGRRHFITDLRAQGMKERVKKTKADVKKELAKNAKNANASDTLLFLNTEFDFHWSIRESQPGADLDDLGLKFYVICGANDHVSIDVTSDFFSEDTMQGLFADYKIREGKRKKGSVLIEGINRDELVNIVKYAIEKHS